MTGWVCSQHGAGALALSGADGATRCSQAQSSSLWS